ncbi:MAG TPA: AzlC family ABC transporter permease [Flexivirga sp.]|uniref:AzlC family ABC transporter permease n=1 Tax=Flexivirga sp. TaxID=1962927 RepID=UPI002C832EDC|nr:AzlC family ABC transporter permease [Flexivirga sp.]HWC20926.1 AzlC family ABC transporter permease [Flexivirga sp.]
MTGTSAGTTSDPPTPADDASKAVARKGIWVGVATGAYGISYGALAVAAGLSFWQAVALSLLLFSGGSQFALVGVIGAGGSGVSAVGTSTLLGLRNGFYGLQVSKLLQVSGWRRAAAAHLTIDESTAVTITQPNRALSRVGFWWTGLSVFVLWGLMSAVGAALGNAMGDPARYGLDAAAPAAFCALVWSRLQTRRAQIVAVAAGAVALIVAPHTASGIPVLIAALVAVVAGFLPDRTVTTAEEI